MNLNTLFTVNTGVAGLFAPEAMLAPYGVPSATIAASVMMGRF